MSLFDAFERDDMSPGAWDEPVFTHLNRSAREKAARVRALLDQWFESYPPAEKADLAARLRAGDRAFHSAFLELYLHALFSCLGFELEAHPAVAGESTHPDYLVRKDGTPLFYLEAIVPGRAAEEAGLKARIAGVYTAIERIASPNFFLAVRDIAGAPAKSPSARALRRSLEEWLAGLDPDVVAAEYEATGVLPRFPWDFAGWKISFQAMPKKADARGKPGVRPVGSTMTQVEMVATSERIRSALVQKARKYGRLDLPYLVAVNLVDEFDHVGPEDWIDLQNALLGDEVVRHGVMTDGTVRETYGRMHNGVWRGPEGSRNTQISGLLLSVDHSPWSVGQALPLLIHHPAADRPFPADLLPISQATLEIHRLWEEMQVQHGPVLNPFKLPPGWPHPTTRA